MFIRKKEYKDKMELLEIYRNKNKTNVDRINDYKSQTYELNKRIMMNQQIIERLEQSNKELLDWINKIINEVGCYKVPDNNQIRIPIYERKTMRSYIGSNMEGNLKRKEIIIPQINFTQISQ